MTMFSFPIECLLDQDKHVHGLTSVSDRCYPSYGSDVKVIAIFRRARGGSHVNLPSVYIGLALHFLSPKDISIKQEEHKAKFWFQRSFSAMAIGTEMRRRSFEQGRKRTFMAESGRQIQAADEAQYRRSGHRERTIHRRRAGHRKRDESRKKKGRVSCMS